MHTRCGRDLYVDPGWHVTCTQIAVTHRTRRAGTYFCSALVTTLLWIASLHAAPGRLPYVLVPSSGPTASVVVPVDANNDGVDDMLRITPYQVTLLSANGQYGWDRRNTDSLMRLSADAYVSGAAQGKHPLVVIPARDRWNPRADSLFFYVIRADSGDDDRTGSERSHWTVMIESIMPDPRRDQSWGINSVSFCDLNGDGEEEALAAVISGYGLQPRGVYAVGPTARTTLWRYGTGFNPGNIVVGDVDGDSLEDIIVGCIAPGNGGLENGLDDGTNYVLCLNRDGTRKWATTLRRVGSGGFVWVAVTDLTGDGRNEVVAVDNCILTDASPDRLLVLDGATGKVVDSAIAGGAAAEQRFQSLTLADLEGRGKPSMVVTRPNGRVEVRDARLRVVHEASLKGEVTMVKTARLLPDSGMQLVVVSTYQNKVSLLDGRLNLLAEYIPSQVPDGIWAVSKGSGKPATLLVRLAKPPSTADLYREFTILMAEPVPNPIPWPWVSAALAALLVGALLAGTYLELLRRRQVRHLVTSSCASVAVLRVDRRRRIVEANPATGELSPSSG
ncbi:VCBS repeat-containing protein, partial [candidate division WOR-3 bacterium]|nr:VCBS repeat-containing protein [candidate division WOR-3 bacterium]